MSLGIATIELRLLAQHLVSQWRRSALAGYEQGITVPDPGHGLDEISPVVVVGHPWNADDASDTAPFLPENLRDQPDGAGGVTDGTGFVSFETMPSGEPRVTSPGLPPVQAQDLIADHVIITPSRRGPDLAYAYAGALAMIWRRFYVRVDDGGIFYIQAEQACTEVPDFEGDDGSWRYDRFRVTLTRHYRAPIASAA